MASKTTKPTKKTTSPVAKTHDSEVATPKAKKDPTVPKKNTKPAAAKPKPQSNGSIPSELIAQRAYYIAEARFRAGFPGDPTQDWLEAEKQLKAEVKSGPAGKKSR